MSVARGDLPGNPTSMRKKLGMMAALLAIGLMGFWWWPEAKYDIRNVHPSLRGLVAPYRSVSTAYYMDGGSIGVSIVDGGGSRLDLALPVAADGPGRTYPRLFIGATHTSKPGAVEVPFSKDTRLMLISIIEQNRSPLDGSGIALTEMRGAPRDYGWVVKNRLGEVWQHFTAGR